MASEKAPRSSGDQSGEWNIALPETIPPPTYAPAFLALGITLLLFGVVSSYIYSATGVVLIVVSISKWVGELLHGD